MIDPLGHASHAYYDGAGLVTLTVDRDGRGIASDYDAAGNLTATVWTDSGGTPDGGDTYTYDAAGEMLTASNGAGTYTLTYDGAGRVATVAGPFGVNLTFGYDGGGNRTVVTDGSGAETDSTFNAAGELSAPPGADSVLVDDAYSTPPGGPSAGGRDEAPSAAAIDSPSVQTTAGGGDEIGTDGGKRVRGRERHIRTDTLGLLLAVAVTAANVSDERATPAVRDQLSLPDRARLGVVFADGRYHDTVCEGWFAAHPGCRLEVGSKPPGVPGFRPIRKRWVVERTFGWLVGQRRLVREYERRVWSSGARVRIASISMMSKRLRPCPDRASDNCDANLISIAMIPRNAAQS